MAESAVVNSPGQPFTFGGVAAYATARVGRFLGMAVLMAALPAAVIGRLATHCWWPVVSEAVAALPATGSIEGGTLRWGDKEGRLLSANRFLSIQVYPDAASARDAGADFGFEFGLGRLSLSSFFGAVTCPYPPGSTIQLNRTRLLPLWEAWKMPLMAGLIVASLVMLVLNWFVLAFLYTPLAAFTGWLARRDLTWSRAWKLSVAAQWPGALLMTFTLALYSTDQISLLFVLVLFAAHFIPSILFALFAPFFLPRAAAEGGTNPFSPEKRKNRSARNPFNKGK